MTGQRDRLVQALRDEFARNETEQLDPFAAGVAAALERRGITGPVPGANPPGKPWNRTVIDTLLADKQAAEEAAARKAAEQAAPPPAPTVAAMVKQALQIEVERLNQPVEEPDNSDIPHLALNSAELLRRMQGPGNAGSVNGGGRW
jgi:hypothetical protein